MAMVSKTREDLPEPDTPVKTVIFLLGISQGNILQVVFPGALDFDVFLCHFRSCHTIH